MRVLLVVLSLLFLPGEALAQNVGRFNVYVRDGNRAPIHHSGPVTDSRVSRDCFPHGCGGISPTYRNPDPDARLPENLTACIYDITDTLIYEREDKVCPYKYINQNETRALLREQEWLRSQAP